MNVKNRKCIRKLSLKSLYANRRRNLIAIFAIALTTLLFTSMFTIVLSLNASYETYQFRQVGGYAHGTFKDVSPEQAERIAAHPKVKAAGARKVIGITAEGVFAKVPAEISYMDANCTKWSYATPTTGRMPESGKEVAMDTAALQLLGVTPELGAEVTVSYSITDKDQTGSFCVPFLTADTGFIITVAGAVYHGKIVCKYTFTAGNICCRKCIGSSCCNGAESIICHSCFHDQSHIMGGDICKCPLSKCVAITN